ncbi:MAG: hypothetical protein J7J98_07460 [candidate division Zixibacteria bacterium]|nr:hypothetical protein [candidate division Zixibacteria bacterium]
MIRKTLLRCVLAGLFLVGLGLTGCSDDTQRIITGTETSLTEQLATDADSPEIVIDWEEYVSQGYYYPEDDEVTNDTGTLDDQFDYDDPNTKPIDNGKS